MIQNTKNSLPSEYFFRQNNKKKNYKYQFFFSFLFLKVDIIFKNSNE
jgi:hypothetical protein